MCHDSRDLDLKGCGVLGEVAGSAEARAHVLVRHGQQGGEPVERPNEGFDQRRQGWQVDCRAGR